MPGKRMWSKNLNHTYILGYFHSSVLAGAKVTGQIGPVVPYHQNLKKIRILLQRCREINTRWYLFQTFMSLN